MLSELVQNFAVEADDSEELRLKKRIFVVAATVVVPILMGIGALLLSFNASFCGWLYIGFALFVGANVLAFGWHKRLPVIVVVLGITALMAHLAGSLSLGGFSAAGAMILWGMFFPVLTGLIFQSARATILWLLAFVVNLFLSIFLPADEPVLTLEMQKLVMFANLLGITTLTVGSFAYFAAQRDLAFKLLRGEQEKSESLLLNILPADIAQTLKNSPQTIAEHFEGASILFADLVGFTPLSASMSPVEIVELLNEVFSKFDLLAERYGVEKIKTIGDCYMVAAGVPRPRADHAAVLVQMALDICELVEAHPICGRKLSFRIGINSGPVVAGVIGRKKFIYDLWGDAVNTASRMESHGTGGHIQITQSTFELVQDHFECKSNGLVAIKGKGPMEVFQVLRPKKRVQAAG